MSISADPMGTDSEFDAYAARYDEALNQGLSVVGEDKEYFARERLRWLRGRLMELGRMGDALLDFGCGTGASTPFFFQELNVASVTGCDVSDGLLDVARTEFGRDHRVRFVRSDTVHPLGEFDLAFTNGVFHHIPLDHRADAARYVFNALRPGGVFAFWENNPWNPGTRYVMSRIPFDRTAVTLTPPESRRLLRSAGFRVLRTDFRFIFPNILAALRPLEGPLASLPLGGQYLVLAEKPVR